MNTLKINKLFNNTLLVSSILTLLVSFILEPFIPLSIQDLLFILVLIIIMVTILILKEEYFNNTILFYDFVLISSLFIYDLKITLSIVASSLLIYSLFNHFYSKNTKALKNNPILSEGYIIIVSLFLAKGSFIVFSQLIDDAPILFVQVILLNLFFHLFYYILDSIKFLFEALELKRSFMLDNISNILANYIYTTTITYLGLVLFTILEYLPIVLLLILNTILAYYFIKSFKVENHNNNLLSIQEAFESSLSVDKNLFQKYYSYVEAIDKTLPTTILGIYILFDNHSSILPICHKCEENIELNNLSFDTSNLTEFIQIMEPGRPVILNGEKLLSFFTFINQLELSDSQFIIAPMLRNSKVIGFTLIHPKYYNYSNNALTLISNSQNSLSLLLDQSLKVVNSFPKIFKNYDELKDCLTYFMVSKIPFTISKIVSSSEKFDFGLLGISNDAEILNTLDDIDKVLFFNDNHLYVLHPIEDSLNVANWTENLKIVLLNSTTNSTDITFTTYEYPTDSNNIIDLLNKLK